MRKAVGAIGPACDTGIVSNETRSAGRDLRRSYAGIGGETSAVVLGVRREDVQMIG